MITQVVIVRSKDGGFRIIEMGLGATQREHELAANISAGMTVRYLQEILENLKPVAV